VSDRIDSAAIELWLTLDASTPDDVPKRVDAPDAPEVDAPEAVEGHDGLPVGDADRAAVVSEDDFWRLAKKGMAAWGHEPSVEEMSGYWRRLIEETNFAPDELEGDIGPERAQDLVPSGVAEGGTGAPITDDAADESNEPAIPQAMVPRESTVPSRHGMAPDGANRELAAAAPTPVPDVTPDAVNWLAVALTESPAARRPVRAQVPEAASRFAPPRPEPAAVSGLQEPRPTGLPDPWGSADAEAWGSDDAPNRELAIAGCLALLEAAELDDARANRPVGLSRAGLAFADGLALLERLRRAQQAHRRWGRQIALPAASLDAHERELRHGVETGAANLLEVALRAAAAGTGASGLPPLRWVEASSNEVTLALAAQAPAPFGFVHVGDGGRAWSTAANLEELERLGASALAPWPALVPLGATAEGRELLVDLVALGVACVDGPPDDAVGLLRAIVVALATATWCAQPRVVVVGMERELGDLPGVESVGTLDVALTYAEAHAHHVMGGMETGEQARSGRTGTVGPSASAQAHDALVVVSALAPQDADTRRRVGTFAGGRCPGVGLLLHDPEADGLVADAGACRLRIGTTGSLRIEGLGIVDGMDRTGGSGGVVAGTVDRRMWARRLDAVDLLGLVALLEVARQREGGEVALRPHLRRGSYRTTIEDSSLPRSEEVAADVDVVVRVLGDLEIVRLQGGSEERLESTVPETLEVLAYLALRECSVTYGTLEANVFPDGPGAAGTVDDVVATARDLVGPVLLRSPTEGRFALSERVVTDYGMFCGLVAQADEAADAAVAAELLTAALGLVRSGPLGGPAQRFSWAGPQREAIVAHVVDAAETLAELRAARHDWEAVEWAVGQGLAAAPGAERLHWWLMRSAHAAGDLPRVLALFDALRDVVADPAVGVEPEDTLQAETVELLESLVSPRAPSAGPPGVGELHVAADSPLPVTAELPEVDEQSEPRALIA
jgi:DNA-binding SARP family transcriptional activator